MGSADYVEIDGRLAFVEQYGSGPAVFCVHTAGQHGFQYRYAARAIGGRGFRAVVIDMPGHGRSEPAADGPISDLPWYADWCLRMIDLLELEKPYLLGCSIGGRIVLDMATKASPRLSGVVAMAAYGQLGRGSRSARPWGLEDSASPSNRERSFYGQAAQVGRSATPETVQLIAEMHCREDWQITHPDQIGCQRPSLWDDLPKITCPTYLVVGGDDFGVPEARVRATAAQIPGARVEVLPGVGHYPMQELPDFADYFVRWVSELTSA